ncbi:MAG: type II toxin-antitoxin system RelE family toxin [Acetobacteraceae bacterium]
MAWRIEFDARAEKELSRIGQQPAQRILKFLAERLAKTDDPRRLGAALWGTQLGDFWKYRIGDHRLIASIEDQTGRIVVLRIGHRRDVYR